MSKIEWKISNTPVEYPEAINFMEERVNAIISGDAPEMVWLLEHPPLYTSGTSAKEEDLLDGDRFPVFQAGRGGEYTYHGPGQLIAYIMLNLKKRNQADLKKYVYNLEELIIRTLEHFDIKGKRHLGRVGIWVTNDNKEEKIAAVGVRVRKWVTYHGISLNISPNLEHFSGIVPCGISDRGVTSLENLNKQTDKKRIIEILKEQCETLF